MTARLHLVSDADRDAERALASRASGGDQSAFEELYRSHSGRVYALCLRMSGSRQRAVELTQDVFVHLWERLGSWRGESALSSWIHRVTVNLVLSNVRSETRRQKHEVTEQPLSQPAESREPTRREAAAENGFVRPASVLDAIDLERAIAALPPGARTVFVLHDVEGYQHDEIAKMTGTAEGTCRAQLHRARKLLMEALER
jgi:RNA polymerase sigma-70 factor (ECF subfamily)